MPQCALAAPTIAHSASMFQDQTTLGTLPSSPTPEHLPSGQPTPHQHRLQPPPLRRDAVVNSIPVCQVELQAPCTNPGRAIEQIVNCTNDTLTGPFPVVRTLRL